jgi:DNA adenine methylase
MKPPFTYYGGKTAIAEQIVALLPEHAHYVEPFAGSLAVLMAKPPARMETVNDLDGELVTFWRMLREQPDQLLRLCALTPHARAEHLAAYNPDDDPLETARRVWVRLTQGRTGRMTPTGWRHTVSGSGPGLTVPQYLDAYIGRLAPAAARLASVSLECRPALDVIAAYGRDRNVLIYADPPYLASTRNGTNYRHEMPTEAQHRELADALLAARSAVVLSGYASPLYDELYAGWHRQEITTGTGQAGAGPGGGYESRTEVLWSNRPLGNIPTLFDDLQLTPAA